jgi:hypothetical protein
MTASKQGAETEDPRLGKLADISKALTGGLTLLAAVLAFVTAREGGLGRLLANETKLLYVGVALVVGSVLLGFASWFVVGLAPKKGLVAWWSTFAMFSLVAFFVSVGIIGHAANAAAEQFERPSVSAALDGKKLTFSASIPLLTASDTMTVTLTGYRAGAEDVPIPAGGTGESRGSPLYFSHTGPDASGRASVQGTVTLPEDAEFETVELRAYRNDTDYGCVTTRPVTGTRKPPKTGCATVWLAFVPPTVTGSS